MSFLQLDEEIKELFLDKIKTILIQGKTVQTVKRKRTSKTKYLKNQEFDEYFAIEKDITWTTDTSTTLDSCPQFVLDIVAESLSTESAIKYLENQGYQVIDPSAVQDDTKQSQGLSEYAVNEIRAKLLGLEDVVIESNFSEDKES